MRYFLAFAAFLIALPALAVECIDGSCNCIGIVYKNPGESGPSGFARRIFSWSKAERRFNNQLIEQRVALMLVSWESQGLHICCELIDNNNANAPWNAISAAYLPAEGSDLDRLIIGLYADTPAAGDRFHFVTGDATTAAVLDPSNPADSGLEITALMGGSAARRLSTAQTVITNARNNQKPTLQSDLITNGCP